MQAEHALHRVHPRVPVTSAQELRIRAVDHSQVQAKSGSRVLVSEKMKALPAPFNARSPFGVIMCLIFKFGRFFSVFKT